MWLSAWRFISILVHLALCFKGTITGVCGQLRRLHWPAFPASLERDLFTSFLISSNRHLNHFPSSSWVPPSASGICRAWYHMSNSLSHSLIDLSLTTSSFSSSTRLSTSSICSYLAQVLPPLLSISSIRHQHLLEEGRDSFAVVAYSFPFTEESLVEAFYTSGFTSSSYLPIQHTDLAQYLGQHPGGFICAMFC